MIRKNFVDIHQLMRDHNFRVDDDAVPDNLKCVRCKSVLKDARQVPCGCTFCRVCIDHMMASGDVFCPGASGNCRETLLSTSAPDYRANLNICRLRVRCSQKNCRFETELVGIEDHLRVCSRTSVECLFHEFGCKRDKLGVDEIDAHFQQENWSHSKILIDMIAGINAELANPKRGEASTREIDILKLEMVVKDREIKSIRDEMKQVENENRSIRDEMKLLVDDLRHVKNENKLITDEMKQIKREKAELAQQVKMLSEKVDKEIDGRCIRNEMNIADIVALVKQEIRSNLGELDKSIKSPSMDQSQPAAVESALKPRPDERSRVALQTSSSSTSTARPAQPKSLTRAASVRTRVDTKEIDTSFVWIINDDVGKTWQCKESEFFHGVKHPYRYRLDLTTDGFFGASMDVLLRIYPGARDAQLSWPFRGIVTITIGDTLRSTACRRIKQKCNIERPPRCLSTCSDEFSFSRPVLRQAGVDLARGVRVSCDIIIDFG